ncbi:MAG: hypothetical protein GF350_10530 [Chitinivibrionales bacterium]|nr:hypothetical protein [Chitinivibrionales bacterium]
MPEYNDHTVFDKKQLYTMLQELETHLKSRKPKLCREITDRIKKGIPPEEFSEETENLILLVSKYKFKDAEEAVNALLRKIKDS